MTVARSSLRDLGQQHIVISIQSASQRRAELQRAPKRRNIHPQRRAGTLHGGAQRRDIDTQGQRGTHHTFAAYQLHLKAGPAVNRYHQRDETADGKVNVLDSLSGFIENGVKICYKLVQK